MVFRRFFNRPPLHDPREKAWVERQMLWFSELFGIETLRNATVLLPTEEHFPEPFNGERSDAERILQRLCGQMQIDPGSVELRFGGDEMAAQGMSGTWHEEDGKTVVTLDEAILNQPELLLATLAHELSHHRLLGEKRMNRDEWDHENLEDTTDLLPVYFGAGIFAANATITDRAYHTGSFEHWSISKSGYLPSRLFGYAFALFAWVRDEQSPAWASHLRKDAKEVFDLGLKYLRKTGDSLFRPDNAGRKEDDLTPEDCVEILRRGTPGARVDALWCLADRGADAQPFKEAIIDACRDRHPSLRETALDTLGKLKMQHSDLQDEVQFRLTDPDPSVRSTAAFALPNVAVNRESAIEELTMVLQKDDSLRVAMFAASALATFESAAAESCPAMAKPLKRALVHGESTVALHIIDALQRIDPDPETFLAQNLPDPDLQREAREMLVEIRDEAAGATAAAE